MPVILPNLIAAASDFFTGESLGTFAGASVATVVVGNTLRKVVKRDLVAIPLIVAIIFAFVAAETTGTIEDVGDVGLILLNGCLLFCTALGIQETLISVTTSREEGVAVPHAARRVGWLDPWYRRPN